LVDLAEHQVRRESVANGLINEYHPAARPAANLDERAGQTIKIIFRAAHDWMCCVDAHADQQQPGHGSARGTYLA
jgi:hypothetical protein